eukprot:747107-Hanusia_phi.AAC.10
MSRISASKLGVDVSRPLCCSWHPVATVVRLLTVPCPHLLFLSAPPPRRKSLDCHRLTTPLYPATF